MSKKYKLLLLFFVGLFLLSSCNVNELQGLKSDIQKTNTLESNTQETNTQKTDTVESTVPKDDCDWVPPKPLFETKNPDEYENFLRSEECSVNLFSLDIFECFGEFSFFETYNVTSFSSATYRYQFDKLDTWIRVGSREVYFNDSDYSNYYGDIYIADEDMPENLRVDPRTHWFRNSENELVEAAYYQKYNIGSDDKYIHFKISDNIALRYGGKHQAMCFIFDDYVMELWFGLDEKILDGSELICTNPTIQALLTKSTSKETAEELYALWKDALK